VNGEELRMTWSSIGTRRGTAELLAGMPTDVSRPGLGWPFGEGALLLIVLGGCPASTVEQVCRCAATVRPRTGSVPAPPGPTARYRNIFRASRSKPVTAIERTQTMQRVFAIRHAAPMNPRGGDADAVYQIYCLSVSIAGHPAVGSPRGDGVVRKEPVRISAAPPG
jgi:hypothetical protein